MKRLTVTLILLSLSMCLVHAQLSSNPNKFLGNITTGGSVNGGGIEFKTLWNQLTAENESKWQSIEGSARNSFNWGGCDNCYNYAKQNGIPFKFHTLIWGAQYPSWMDRLSTEQQYKAIIEWFDAVKKRYPDLPLIDVVNEAVPGHQPAPYREALGGEGVTGYDWIIKAFELAHERWPDAILIYNDYNTFQWQRNEFIALVQTLIDAGAPIDAYGCQSHDLTDMNVSDFKSAMTQIQNALRIPMYSTEYDIGTSDDALQLQRYKEQIPYMWEADYVAGITLWGYIYGRTWTTDGNSGIIRNGKDRPAMAWLREYMQSDAARNAKGPFPGHLKEASVYVAPEKLFVTLDEPFTINVRARLRTKTIDHIDFYVGSTLLTTFTEAPYTLQYTPTKTGKTTLRAVVTATDGTTFERLSHVTVNKPRAPYKGIIELPGTLQAENFDSGGEGVAYHDNESTDQGGTGYRTDGSGVDVVRGGTGYAVGYTAVGEWLEYTVHVAEPGIYSYEAYASSGATGSAFNISLHDDAVVPLTGRLNVPCVTSGNWDTYKALCGRFTQPLDSGRHVLRIAIEGANCNIDRVLIHRVVENPDLHLDVTVDPESPVAGSSTSLHAEVTTDSAQIKNVEYYLDGVLLKRILTPPYNVAWRPTTAGTYVFTVVANDKQGMQSNMVTRTVTVQRKRTPYKGAIALPGIVEAENFDKGGEGFTFHDSDSKDEGGTGYRTDSEGVDIVKGNGGYAIGYTAVDEWLEYTVDVKTAGRYSFEAVVSSGADGSAFGLALNENGSLVTLATRIAVPNSGSWDTYRTIKASFSRSFTEGQHIIRLTIKGANCNIDKITFNCVVPSDIEALAIDDEGDICDVYTPDGIHVGEFALQSPLTLGSQLRAVTGERGIFIVRHRATGVATRHFVRE